MIVRERRKQARSLAPSGAILVAPMGASISRSRVDLEVGSLRHEQLDFP